MSITSTKNQPGAMTISSADLAAILDKLQRIESALLEMQQQRNHETDEPKTTLDEVLLMKLSQLTMKRHAVLTATLGGVSYQGIADLMQCSDTTVKLHLKGAMDSLGIPDRSALLVSHKAELDAIPDAVYLKRFGISKRWWMEDKPSLMAVLTNTKPPANQHTKEPA